LPFRNKKYAKNYMKKYRKIKKTQTNAIIKAAQNGDLEKVKRLAKKKPGIHLRKRKKKRGKK